MRAAIVGGGIIGLSIAAELLRRGADVTVYDPAPDGTDGAWHVAAGMLAPGGESVFEVPQLERLLEASGELWPAFAAGLGEVGYDSAGTLGVALTADDVTEMAREWKHQKLAPLTGSQVRDLAPALSPRIRAGAYAPTERQVDPRRVVGALRAALDGRTEKRFVSAVSELEAEVVVVAAGCGTAALTGLPIRPVKGQVLRLRGEPGLLRHVIDGAADGRHVYLVPRADGEVVVGATQEERTDRTPTAGGVHDLLRAALDLVPGLAEHELAEVSVGHRPGTPDNAPILGTLRDNVIVAAGHHRNGILLAPITARLIADLVLTGETDPIIDAFTPGRFGCA
ncbi:putative thiamine biosynthesis oxidoreductase ThiO [Actinoplanes ianthinogenes]|uniref:glycine oxidase n=1 Tax=Actinoplanes ianthinogenes TaxID=122358 RepID=A0ABN6CGT0_9ACTN|nr:glycine oxidase ThiO [Actinoplanes ianthinogenes]BCJ44323.1 putative thiamine biosynthesis oxidoreductase ThiO [Actinoplanes ianthinogenes]GGQ97268.1 putative thiamine biosynthesis oxidoreductase ThiO [Actinoplanes ianthinogenes]